MWCARFVGVDSFIRKRRRAVSISSVLEGIWQAVRRQEERAKVEKSIDAYYSSLSDKQSAELAEWGDFATSEFLGAVMRKQILVPLPNPA
jgi:hypothetical protein